MALTASLGLGNFSLKFCYGSLIGGALGFLAGKMSNSSSNSNNRLTKHIRRFGEQLSSDPELSLDLFKDSNNSSSNNIDYQTSRKDFISAQKSYNFNDNEDYEDLNYNTDSNRFRSNDLKSENEFYDTSNRYKSNYDPYTVSYDLNNYTSRYDKYDY